MLRPAWQRPEGRRRASREAYPGPSAWRNQENMANTDNEQRNIQIDLHGYAVSNAIAIAKSKIKEAWENGFDYITLIHGARASRHHFSARNTGYGAIKWELRSALSQGYWKEWVFYRRSKKHSIGAISMKLKLRPNSNPNSHPNWTFMPDEDYS
jgi:hypothetical protein